MKLCELMESRNAVAKAALQRPVANSNVAAE